MLYLERLSRPIVPWHYWPAHRSNRSHSSNPSRPSSHPSYYSHPSPYPHPSYPSRPSHYSYPSHFVFLFTILIHLTLTHSNDPSYPLLILLFLLNPHPSRHSHSCNG